MGSIITLTTDFGLSDGYVAAMKGVIYSINPEATVVDVSHVVQPQNILQAAFILSTAYSYFPKYTVHLVIVDPGVGTDRRAIILKTPQAQFVAPDNGVLSYILDTYASQLLPDSTRVKLGPDLKAYAITRSEYWRHPVSKTFHGRDILAPVAARLSLGMPALSLGDNIDTVTALPLLRPKHEAHQITGHILHIDTYGNLITNFKESDLSGSAQSSNIIFKNCIIDGIRPVYAEGTGAFALFGSSGYLEIAMANSSAAAYFQAKVGEEIIIRLKSKSIGGFPIDGGK
jgi:S-adenosylmethionine hydrolase